MGFWDFLVPAELPYPGMSTTGNGGRVAGGGGTPQVVGQPGNAAAAGSSGVLDKIFSPADLPYPLPVVSTTGNGSSSQASGQPQPPVQNALICLPTSLQPVPQAIAVPQPIALPQPIAVPQPIALPQPTPQPVALPQPAPATAPVASPAPAPSAPAAPASSNPAPSPVTVVIAPWPMPIGQQSTPTASAAASCPSASTTDGSASATPGASSSSAPALPANDGSNAATTTVATQSAPTAQAISSPSASAPVPTLQATMAVRPAADSLIFPPPPDENEKRLMSYCTNPRLRARTPKAQEVYLEDVLGEVVTVKMLSKDATPVAFAVPDGTDAVEITIGPIEVDPDAGSADGRSRRRTQSRRSSTSPGPLGDCCSSVAVSC